MSSAADSSAVRRRNVPSSSTPTTKSASSATQSTDVGRTRITFFDIVRVVLGLALCSTLGSYAVTNGSSYIWGYPRPWWTRPDRVQLWLKGPLLLTNEELAAYDGTDPSKPILLALNRTIYDVSASRAVYGPGGPYAKLAAKDASRSYITTCFDPVHDLVPYFGGVEEIYVPLWLSKRPGGDELDAIAEGEVVQGMGIEQLMTQVKTKIGRRRVNAMQKDAYAAARERVRAQVRTWEGMFTRKDYPVVGRVVGVNETDPTKYAALKFCEAALKQRPPMAESLGLAMEALGHEGGKIDIGKMKKKGSKGLEGVGPDWAVPLQEGNKGGKKFEEARENAAKAAVGVDGEGHADEVAKASIDDMIKGGKYNDDEKEKKERKMARDQARLAHEQKKRKEAAE